MANDKGLVSLALIKTSWEENQSDSIDMLIPFVLFSIHDVKKGDIISVTDTRKKIKVNFGIDIYNNVLEIIFKRLTLCDNSGNSYIKKKKGVYYRSIRNIDVDSFNKKREHYKSIQRKVIKAFVKFLSNKNLTFDSEVAEKELITYLCKYGHTIINENVSAPNDTTIWTKRIGEFIEYVSNQNEPVFQYLKDIAKGGMLSAVYFSINYNIKPSQKFKNTKIYLDTPLLMHVLNYSGEALQKSVQELLDLLQSNGATIHSFEHNLEELKSILEAYITRYRQGTLNTSHNFDYLIENDVKPEKIETDIPSLKYELKSKGISIDDTPDFDDYWKNIGHTAFNDYLSQNIHYKKDNRRDNDVNSIASIYRLRSRNRYHKYETCEALFVATNSYLVYHTQKYFRENENKNGIPAIVDDTFLTSLLWVKYMNHDDTLPTSKIIVDALAAQEPSKTFWDNFNQKIDELQKRGEITEEELIDLKYNTFSKKNMFDVTEGDTSKITHETVCEVQKMNFRMQHKEVIEEKEEAIADKNKAEQERDYFKTKFETIHQQLIAKISQPYLKKTNNMKKISNRLGILIVCALIYFIIGIFTTIFEFFANYKLLINLGLTGVIIFVGGILNIFVDKTISNHINKISNWFFKKYISHLYSTISPQDNCSSSEIIDYIKNKLEKTPH